MEQSQKASNDNRNTTPTDQKPMSQPHIRRLALIVGIIALLGVIAVAALAFALNRPASNQTQQTTPSTPY